MVEAKPRVVVLDDYQGVAAVSADWSSVDVDLVVVREHIRDVAKLLEAIGDAAIVVAMRERTPLPRPVIEQLPSVRMIVTTGARNDSIDVAAANEHGIVVCGTDALISPTAELTWALILAVARRLPDEHQRMRSGGWQETVGIGLEGRTLGVLGLGRLGSRVAAVGNAFGMEVTAWSENLTADAASSQGVRRVDRDELFATADVLTIHQRLSDRTRGLVGRDELALMKSDAILVNTSRAAIVDTDALMSTLRERRLFGAGLDVYDDEPLPADHPLRTIDRVVLTPHLGYVTRGNYEVFFDGVVEAVAAFLSGSPIRVVEP